MAPHNGWPAAIAVAALAKNHGAPSRNPLQIQVSNAFRECALAHYTADPLLILADAKIVTHTISTSGMRV